LRSTAQDAGEQSDVDLDLARARLQSADLDGAKQALENVPADSSHAMLGRVARLTVSGDAAGDALLAELSKGLEGDAAVAFAVARTIRATRKDETDARAAAVDALAAASEGDEIAAFVRAAAMIKDRPGEAAEVLRELARASNDPSTRDVLRVASA